MSRLQLDGISRGYLPKKILGKYYKLKQRRREVASYFFSSKRTRGALTERINAIDDLEEDDFLEELS